MLPHSLKVASALTTSLTEGGRGMYGTAFPKQPAKPLKLYEFEACPFCRRVREVLTLLNLDVEIYPCPKNGTRFRPEVKTAQGKAQFPYLVDENTGDRLFESADIIAHLFRHYGVTGEVPAAYRRPPRLPVLGMLGTAASASRGMTARSGNKNRAAPQQLLNLWGFEASPFTRLVRERLTELELPYVSHTVAKERWQDMGPAKLRLKPGTYQPIRGGKRDKTLTVMGGKMQVPYLEDPNTGIKLFESKDILSYLDKQYG